MKLRIQNQYTYAIKISPEEEAAIEAALSVEVPGAKYMQAVKWGKWDGKKKFWYRRYKSFLTGFLPFVLDIARKNSFKVKLIDEREAPRIKKKNIKRAKKFLRDHQSTELDKILNHTIKWGKTEIPWIRGIAKHPTGSGKSFFAVGMSKALKVKTLIIVSSVELLYQMQAVFQKLLPKEKIGIIGDGNCKIAKRVNIGIVNTLFSRVDTEEISELLQETELVIVDECHHDSPKKAAGKGEKKGMYYHVIKQCNAYYRFGFSASPLVRGDIGDFQLIGDTSDIVSVVNRSQLEEDQLLAKVKVYTIEIHDPKISAGVRAFDKVRKIGIVNNDYRNDIIIREATEAVKKRNELTLVLTSMVQHGKDLVAQLRHNNVPCVFLYGGSSKKKRKRILKDVQRRKDGIVIVANRVYDEGVNAPNVRTLILAGGGASQIKTLQKVGRGTRPKEGGDNIVKVVDFIDLTHEFLEKHSHERLAVYEAEGFKIIRQE